jgi:hypothetical protein
MIKTMLPLVAVLGLATSPIASAQSAPQDWQAGVKAFDGAYWKAYNDCDIKTMDAMNADDMEMYHDAGGVLRGRAEFSGAMSRNICGTPNVKVRRAEVAGTIQFFPMHSNGKLYGAIVSGEHEFYRSGKDMPESLTGRARFTHLLVLGPQGWKVSRVLSYDHTAAPQPDKPLAIELGTEALDRLVGKYTATDKMVLTVSREGAHLVALAGPQRFELYPSAHNEFFLKERPITVTFSAPEAGKPQRLTVRERGAVVAEASASK